MKKQIIYLILCAISVVLAYGKPIEIKGFMAVGLWFAPPALMIFCIKNGTKPFRRASAAVLTLYVIATGLFLIRENAFYTYSRNFSMNPESRRSAEMRMDNSPIYGNPMVYDREYFSLIENTGVLSVRVLLSEKKYSYYPPGC